MNYTKENIVDLLFIEADTWELEREFQEQLESESGLMQIEILQHEYDYEFESVKIPGVDTGAYFPFRNVSPTIGPGWKGSDFL